MEQRKPSTVYSLFSLRVSRTSIFTGFVLSCLLFLLLFTFLALNLPGSSANGSVTFPKPKRLNKTFFKSGNPDAANYLAILGRFGQIMVGMLADDLPFTVFVPSEKHFQEILGEKTDIGDKAERGNLTEGMTQKSNFQVNSTSSNAMATISRILGFSAVPLPLLSMSVPLNDELIVDSLSGFRVHLARVSNGILLVNNISCEVTDIRRGQIIVHVVRGVIMDAEFEQSVRPQDEDSE